MPHRSSAGRVGSVLAYRAAFFVNGADFGQGNTSRGMGKVTIILIVILVVAIAAGCVVLAYWDFPAPSSRVEKVLPDARFPK